MEDAGKNCLCCCLEETSFFGWLGCRQPSLKFIVGLSFPAIQMHPASQWQSLRMFSGTCRFNRLVDAVRDGKVVPPVDLRYLKKGHPAEFRQSDASRARVMSFLQGIYESVAETLPDVRDDTHDDFDSPNMAIGLPELADPYADALQDDNIKPMALSSVRSGKRKARKKKRSVVINPMRQGLEERFLPPGHIRDYWEQMNAAESSDARVAFSTFWRVWYEEFSFLKFRSQSSHAMCSTCVQHRLLIREMSGHLKARQQQMSLYASHLRLQYADRTEYWQARGRSRMRSSYEACLILDGIDQAKFAYPRSDLFRVKELASVQRPRAHISGLILHGWLVVFTVSPSNLAKDANSCIESTAFALTLLAKHIDLSKVTLTVQSDNTVREVKNNFYIRWLSSLVSHGSLALKPTGHVLFRFFCKCPIPHCVPETCHEASFEQRECASCELAIRMKT